MMVTYVTKHDGSMIPVTGLSHISWLQVTRSYNIKKVIKGSEIDNVI